MSNINKRALNSRRQFLRNASVATIAATPIVTLAESIMKFADGDEVIFADGPRPIVNNFQVRWL
jgi:hypothetical protein